MDNPTDEEIFAHAEAYYSDPDNLIDLVYSEYIEHKGGEFESVYAVQLIQTYIKVERPIPAELNSYVAEACIAWENAKGNARLVGKANTQRNLAFDVQSIDIAKKFAKVTKQAMFRKLNPDNPDTLEREYRRFKKQGK